MQPNHRPFQFRGWIIVSRVWTWLFSAGRASGVVIFPFIFLMENRLLERPAFVNHERIHIAQMLETGVVLFYLIYLAEFCWHYARQRDFDKAYRRISFEREAYEREGDLTYLDHRPFWAFWAYR